MAMREVAHHLQMEANRLFAASQSRADLFARSAFNRYYYSTYHIVRSMLGKLKPEWKSTPHRSIPELISGQIKQKFKEGRNQASRAGDAELVRNINSVIAATEELSRILRVSYSIRVAADYEIERNVEFENAQRFALDGTSITDAHQWPEKADAFTSQVLQTWNQLH